MAQLTQSIRNIAICGHGGTGKTTLTEQMLFDGGIISKPETIESGKTVSDFTEEEIAKKISVHTSIMNLVWKNKKINLMDTPGAGDFVGEVVCSFRAAETAIMVVDGSAGIQVETIKLWRRLDHRNMPRAIFINKMDTGRADYDNVLTGLKESFKVTPIPISIPWGSGENFKGVISLLDMTAYMEGGKPSPIPEELMPKAKELQAKLIEMAAEGDDELTEKFFENDTLEGDDIIKGLKEGFRENHFVPVFAGCASRTSGMKPLMDFIALASPSPNHIKEPIEPDGFLKMEDNAPFRGIVFKTYIDKFSGKMSFVKVISGKLKAGEAYNSVEDTKVRINKIYISEGKNLKETDELHAGDIGVVTKVEPLKTNDTLCEGSDKTQFKHLALPHPIYSLAIRAAEQKDEDKLSDHLHRIAEQDLTFSIEFNKETKETVISGMGVLHLNSILEKLEKESKIKSVTKIPRVPYRETITKSSEAEYAHKKQSGGHGQYGKVNIRVTPLARGENFSFSNDVKGGAISKGYMQGIEKGLLEAMDEGYLAGYPMVDIGVSVYDGKEHQVDSSEMAFKLAAKHALKIAFESGKATLLEPVVNLTVFVDDQYMGDVLSDLSTKRGKVIDQKPEGAGITSILAQVPRGELMKYSIDLKAITSGTGAFEMEFSHYDPVTGKIAQTIISESGVATAH